MILEIRPIKLSNDIAPQSDDECVDYFSHDYGEDYQYHTFLLR